MNKSEPLGQIELKLDGAMVHDGVPHIRTDMSAIVRDGDTLFMGCDEATGIEILQPAGPQLWGHHTRLPMSDFTDLPAGANSEIDIEGMAISDGWLWITGSHALKRPLPKPGVGPEAALLVFDALKFDRNRQFLGRLPLVRGTDGTKIVRVDGDRKAGHVAFTGSGKIRKWLKKDPLIGPTLTIPAKENGFNVEGLAARGDSVWLGLREPVLRNYAVVMKLEFEGDERLTARWVDGRRRYRLFLLPTQSEGIRDLCCDGDDLVLLVGAALAGDGGSAILRWRGGATCDIPGIRPESEMEIECALPYRGRTDNPEGLTRWTDDHWLVVHDAPDPARLARGPDSLLADLWPYKGPTPVT